MKFDKAGRYSFELYIDDGWTSGLPLFINQYKRLLKNASNKSVLKGFVILYSVS
jgi:hypothetical protein